MSAREATLSDIPALLSVIEEFHAASPFWSRWAFEPEAVTDLCTKVIKNHDGLLLLGERGGFGMFAIAPVPFSARLKTCLEIGLYGKGDVFSILRAAVEWARGRGAHVLPTAAHHGMKDPSPIYQRYGFERLETLFVKEL